MTQEIIIDVFTHVIITHKDGHYPITADQNKHLTMIGQTDFIEVDGNKIKGSSIAEVMTMTQYYATYPEKRPDPADKYVKPNKYNYREIHLKHLDLIERLSHSELLTRYRKLSDFIRDCKEKNISLTYNPYCLATDMLQAIKYHDENKQPIKSSP